MGHDSVSLVISHCGMASAQEALYFHKPLLCLPVMADQADVARRVADAGAGSVLDKHAISASGVRAAVRSLLLNGSYARQAAVVGAHLRAAGGVKAAGDTLEQAMRLGTDYLR